jgi:hypothetical protein
MRACVSRVVFSVSGRHVVTALDLKFEQGAFVARQGALHAVGIALMLEGQRHLRGFDLLIQVDDLTAFAACFAEQAPREGIQQGRLTRAVMTRDAGEVECVEIKLDGVAIG